MQTNNFCISYMQNKKRGPQFCCPCSGKIPTEVNGIYCLVQFSMSGPHLYFVFTFLKNIFYLFIVNWLKIQYAARSFQTVCQKTYFSLLRNCIKYVVHISVNINLIKKFTVMSVVHQNTYKIPFVPSKLNQ